MAKKTTKKKFSFFSTEPKSIDEGYAQYTGMQIAAGGGPPGSEKFTASKKSKFGFTQAKDDFLMDIGVKKKGIDYYARLDDRIKRGREASNKLGKDLRGNPATDRSRPRGETAAERAARLKKEALEKRKAEGKERRKKFYKQKDERLAKLKAKLLNLA